AELATSAGDTAEARRHLEAYLVLAPKDVARRLELGEVLQKAGHHDDAIALLRAAETAARSDPARRVEIVARIGSALEAAGRDDDALAEYDRATKLAGRVTHLRTELVERVIG